MAKNIMDQLDRSMNFSYIVENLTNIAYDLITESKKEENRYSEVLKEDLSFECENFLYDVKAYPTIKLENSILDKHEDLILKNFNKKEIIIENDTITYYEYKNDNNILISIDPLTEELVLRYNNNFINEKADLVLEDLTDTRKEKVSNFLLKENTLAEIDNLEALFEESTVKYDNLGCILEDYAIKYIANRYDILKHNNELVEITYNEIVSEGKIIPIVGCINTFTEEILSMYAVQPKADYNNKYFYTLEEIYRCN